MLDQPVFAKIGPNPRDARQLRDLIPVQPFQQGQQLLPQIDQWRQQRQDWRAQRPQWQGFEGTRPEFRDARQEWRSQRPSLGALMMPYLGGQ